MCTLPLVNYSHYTVDTKFLGQDKRNILSCFLLEDPKFFYQLYQLPVRAHLSRLNCQENLFKASNFFQVVKECCTS